GASFTQRTISSISTVSISLEDFLPFILLLMVIIVAVVIVMVIWAVVVIVDGVSFIIKLSFMVIGFFLRTILLYQESFQFRPGDLIGFFYSNRLDLPDKASLVRELGLLSLAIDAAYVFRVEEMPSLISC
ncbi:hypothetical protein Tco_1358561, partial [Tanacetum coccineum]